MAVFINIGSEDTYLGEFESDLKSKIYAFGVRLIDGKLAIIENAT